MPLVTLRDLAARPYDLVRDKWPLMRAFIAARDVVVADPDAQVKINDSGTQVTLRDSRGYTPRFKVRLSGRSVTVGWGYVDDFMPTLGGITLDGRDAEGADAPTPRLEIGTDAEPGDDGRSFVCLRALYDAEGIIPLIEEDDWLTIVHLPDLAAARLEADDTVAIEPLAVLYWQETRILRARQVVMHNLQHHYIPGPRGRHHFSAV